jgi:prolyl-tRNA synthetase
MLMQPTIEYQKGCPYHTDRQEWPSSKCQVTSHKGIEVGHTFLLGTKYSDQFNAVYTDSQGKQAYVDLGCCIWIARQWLDGLLHSRNWAFVEPCSWDAMAWD